MSKIDLTIHSNVLVRGYRNGEEIYRCAKHNIWLDNGRTWLMKLLGFDMTGYVRSDPPPDPAPLGSPPHDVYPPGNTYEDRRIMFVGVGIGGNQQTGPIPSGGAGFVDDDYPGGNTQSDADPTVIGLERPVRARVDTPTTWRRWMVPVSIPAGAVGFPYSYPYTWVNFRATFDLLDINTGVYDPGGVLAATYPVVPISELGLFAYDPDANHGTHYIPANPLYDPPVHALTQALAYATIPTFQKTVLSAFVVDWQIRVK